jgi:hypothetical protein
VILALFVVQSPGFSSDARHRPRRGAGLEAHGYFYFRVKLAKDHDHPIEREAPKLHVADSASSPGPGNSR